MTNPGSSATNTASSIESLDAFARQLYRRARTAGHEFADIATVVRGLHTVLKHLRAEAEDQDSLLNSVNPNAENSNSIYARQLMPIVEDCDFTLKQLDTILEKYGGSGRDSPDEAGDRNGAGASGRKSKEVESREKDMIALIRTKLANQKTNIDIFLDTVQLHNPVKARRPLANTNDQQLDAIKDQVDEIATRIFHRRGSAGSEDEEELWQQFRTELEKAGFSSDVLRSNKEVLRAYIRELDSHDTRDGEALPSVRGLLGNGNGNGNGSTQVPPPPMTITPASYPGDNEAISPKESFRSIDNEKFSPDVKNARPVPPAQGPQPLDPRVPQSLQPYYRSQPPALYNQQSSGLNSFEQESTDSSDTDSHSSRELAIISTRDLMAIDYRAAELMAARMGAMHLGLPPNQPPHYSYTPGNRYLPTSAQPPLSIMAPGAQQQLPLPPDHQLSSSPGTQQLLGTSPRYVPPYPPEYSSALSPISSTMTPPPAYGSSPTMPVAPPHAFPSSAPTSGSAMAPPNMPQQRYSRLAPDSRGRDIPLDAKWTRIKRSLVSPAVLEKAHVRYEARPDFVAVLGVLTRDQIEEFARQSAEVRSSRGRDRDGSAVRPAQKERDREAGRGDRGERYADKRHGSNETYNDREKRRNRKDRVASSDSDSDVLWDESDTTEDERDSKRRRNRDRKNRHRIHSPDDDIEKGKDRDSSTNGTRFIPIIVPPPSSGGGSGADRLSPASTVGPKPILKNRNTNHVRFDADGPKEFLSSDDFSRSPRPKDGDRDHRHRGQRNDRDRDRHRDGSSRRDRGDRDKERGDREIYHDRERDRDRDRDRPHHHHHRHRDRDYERGDRDRDRGDRRSDDKAAKKSALRETLGAVGIGGAAASLLSVLTEAASAL